MSNRRKGWLAGLLLCGLLLGALPAATEVENTAHDLAVKVSGGDGRSMNSCAFCHTPHNARPTRALWSRADSGVSYKLYESSTLQASVSQPTGSSRMCLSCHDGTIALDDRPAIRPGGRMGFLTGKATLGTDLSDDHPVSFVYDAALALAREELADPSLLPSTTRLDVTRQLQCTSCHDAHQDQNPKFLTEGNRFSKLCLNCHQMKGWPASVHATSTVPWQKSGPDAAEEGGYQTVAENGCGSCHSVHSADRPQWLLNFSEESRNCFVCHNGSTASKNVEREFRKFSAHPVAQSPWIHSPREDPRFAERHVSCSDCHSPHATESAGENRQSLSARLQGVPGINSAGAPVAQASFGYEVCYSCHGVAEQPRTTVVRQDHVTNSRQEFDPGNRSFHPVVSPGRNPSVLGLVAGYTTSTLITCTDCHNSDTPTVARGPHGSTYEPILEREYQLQDPSPGNFKSYALCYKCHDQTTLLSDQSGFSHRRHVVQEQASCAVCHDAHGSRNNTHLVNFMTRSKTGMPVVTPSANGQMRFTSLGQSRGECYLSCHGSDHGPKRYPAQLQAPVNTPRVPSATPRRFTWGRQ